MRKKKLSDDITDPYRITMMLLRRQSKSNGYSLIVFRKWPTNEYSLETAGINRFNIRPRLQKKKIPHE